jgi:hypothetical protein
MLLCLRSGNKSVVIFYVPVVVTAAAKLVVEATTYMCIIVHVAIAVVIADSPMVVETATSV